MGRPDLSIVLLAHNRNDAEAFESRRVEVIANGIPDPCPRFDFELGARRRRRTLARRKLLAGENIGVAERLEAGEDPEVFRVLFLSLCCREKGLFDAIEAVAQANIRLGRGPVRVELSVAGAFARPEVRAEFEARVCQPDLNQSGPLVRYIGFVAGEEKTRLLANSDCLCFPTYYSAESFGIVLIEAMAFGLPVVTTRWRGLDELLPPGYAGLVDLRSPDQIAARLLKLMRENYDDALRRKFEASYTDEVFARNIRVALQRLT
jgi:glycosyltransferase involved in cell wall biosynthesis